LPKKVLQQLTTPVRDIASDGEGAAKLIEVWVTGARDAAQAKRVGKSVVNSPLVKTAVLGAYPNWGGIAVAIGKPHEETDIEPSGCAPWKCTRASRARNSWTVPHTT
jgi:glutamate N-acetyltransferase/amino-acid N-acetyltransferase